VARQLRIEVLCDACLANDHRAEADESFQLTVGNGQPRELDLCAEHAPPIQAALDMLGLLGHPVAEVPVAAAGSTRSRRRSPKGESVSHPQPDDPASAQHVDRRCKICSHVSSTGNAMWQHARQIHELTRAQYRDAETVPGSALSGITEADVAHMKTRRPRRSAQATLVG